MELCGPCFKFGFCKSDHFNIISDPSKQASFRRSPTTFLNRRPLTSVPNVVTSCIPRTLYPLPFASRRKGLLGRNPGTEVARGWRDLAERALVAFGGNPLPQGRESGGGGGGGVGGWWGRVQPLTRRERVMVNVRATYLLLFFLSRSIIFFFCVCGRLLHDTHRRRSDFSILQGCKEPI